MKTPEEIREIALNGRLTEAVAEAAWMAGKLQTTDYRDGRHDALMDVLKITIEFMNFFKTLTVEQQHAAEALLFDDAIWLWKRGEEDTEKIYFTLNMNDTFAYACADCEDVSLEELPEVAKNQDIVRC